MIAISSTLTFNCIKCGEELSFRQARKSYDESGLIVCDCCNEPTQDDREEYFAYLVESGQVVLA
jgi:transcription elongation factor Elf1